MLASESWNTFLDRRPEQQQHQARRLPPHLTRSDLRRVPEMLGALRNLDAARKEGLIDDTQYEKSHAKILACDPTVWADVQRSGAGPSEETVAKLQGSVDTLMGMMKRDSVLTATDRAKLTPQAKRAKLDASDGTLIVRPRAREPTQRSVFDMNVTADLVARDGRAFRLTEEQFGEPQLARFLCPFQGCGRRFKRECHLKNHERTHQGPRIKEARSVLQMQSMRSLMSAARLQNEHARDVKLLLWCIVDQAVSLAGECGGWIKKIDGRKNNRGADHRVSRSAAFKVRVVESRASLRCPGPASTAC